MNSTNKFALMCAASVLALTAGARAQQENTEAVTVTGSRVISDITLSPTPITVVTAEQLTTTTPTTIPDALNKLPDFIGGANPRQQGNGSTNNSGNTLNLRNLGSQRTLVLLDGRRLAATNQTGQVDVDTLPQMLMSRVDVVTGGASAVYGSDAVAGVVNFILDKKFTGFKYDMNAGLSKYGDGAEEKIGLAWGTELFGGRGHYEMSVRAFQQDMIPIGARPYGYQNNAWVEAGNGSAATPFVDVPFGRLFNQSLTGTIKCGATCSLTNYTFKDGQFVPMTHGIPTSIAGLESGGDGGYANPADTTMQARQRNAEFFNRFSYDITPNVNFYLEASAAESGDYSKWTPLAVSSAGSRPNTFFTNNAYLSAQQQAQLTAAATAAGNFVPAPVAFTQVVGNITSIAPAVAPNTPYFSDAHYINKVEGTHASFGDNVYATKTVNRSLSLTTGISGTLSGFNWEAYYSHQENRLTVSDPQNTNNAKYMAAQDAVIAPAGTKINGVDVGGTVQCWVTTQAQFASLYPGCVPINVFDSNGISQTAFNYLKTDTFWTLTQKMDNLAASISGGLFGLGLPAGEITGALSAEMRWRAYDQITNALPTDFVNCTGLRMCTVNGGAAPALWTQNVNAPVSADDNVWETALELNVPILKDVPLAEELSADFAGRYTSYSISGEAQTWKIGVNDRISDAVRVRGTMSFDIRAPNLDDLFRPVNISSTGFQDQLTTGVNSTQLVNRGNAALKPEQAHTYTLGVVVTPDFIPGLTTSLDYYQTHMTQAITSISYQNTSVQQLCINSAPTYNSPFCALAVRPITDPTNPNFKSPTLNYPTQVLSSPINSGLLQMEGWNFEADYNFDWADVWSAIPGSMTIRHLLTYQPVLERQDLPGTPFAWTNQPKTRQTTFINYQVGDWGFNIQNQWLSGAKKATGFVSQNYVVPRLNSVNVMDVTIDRRFDLWGGSSTFYFNVQNIGNTRAPLRGQNPSVPGLFYPAGIGGNGPNVYNDVGRYFTIGLKGNF
jgi:outer membrane receptor protein involved in Fe transport